ncbi:hypothetical protein T484DRAFT_1750947 [Baffinella frigidus]|nr:hypothetical protein T484DRAFT_1750947 [Cryptophyta sp. CCMP2293]
MSAPTTPSRPDQNVSATSPWGYGAGLLRHRSETSLTAPLAIPNARAVCPPRPDVVKELSPDAPVPDGGGAGAQGANEEEPPAVVSPGGEEEDHVLQALREKFATTFYYAGLLLHEPAALDLLMRCAADQMRAREMAHVR